MSLFQSFLAIFRGLQLCLFNSEVRKLAIVPWAIGFISFTIFAFCGFYFFEDIVRFFGLHAPEGLLAYVWYSTKILLISFSLLISVIILSVISVLVLAGPFQTSIAAKVMLLEGVTLPVEASGIGAITSSVARSVLVETAKLLWLIPLGVLVFVIGLFPFLLPIAFLLAAWLLAYQFIDIPLDVLQMSAGQRFRYAWSHKKYLVLFGGCLTLLWAIPLLGLFLAPAAAAGAAWLVSQEKLKTK